MRFQVIACEVLARPLYLAAVYSPHMVDIKLVEKGLHHDPEQLRPALQAAIDAVEESRYDAVLLGYALCSNSTAGLRARGLPLVLPRAHDCITLYLGSRKAYSEEFDGHPGTYYYTGDYTERSNGDDVALGAVTEAQVQREYAANVEKYGKENADYLLEVMGGWRKHYKRAAFIALGVGNEEAAISAARDEAAKNDWEFAQLAGDIRLLRKLAHGEWDEEFLQVPPGQAIRVTYDENIVHACPVER